MALFKIVVWAIIFLTKLRFPPGISIATVLKDKLTLQKAIELCQISELPEQRMKELTSTHEVNEVKYPRHRQRQQQQTEEKQHQPRHQQRQASGYRDESGKSRRSAGKKGEGYRQKSCTYCGNVHRQRNCPAYGKECRACGKLNHFERVCRSTATQATKQNQQINTVIEEKQGIQPFLIEKLDTYNIQTVSHEALYVTVEVHSKPLKLKVDTGA